MPTVKDYFEAMFINDPDLKEWQARVDADPNKRKCYGSPHADGCDCCPSLFECEEIVAHMHSAKTLQGVIIIKEET